MEAALWYVLTGTRGGTNRVRLLRALDDRPRNANQLAENLGLDYKTVRHHLDVLMENDVVERSGDDYGAVYLPTPRTRTHWDTIEEIMDQVELSPRGKRALAVRLPRRSDAVSVVLHRRPCRRVARNDAAARPGDSGTSLPRLDHLGLTPPVHPVPPIIRLARHFFSTSYRLRSDRSLHRLPGRNSMAVMSLRTKLGESSVRVRKILF